MYRTHVWNTMNEDRPTREAAIIAFSQSTQTLSLWTVPYLIKGYVRMDEFFGDGAVIDEQFNTTDVCIIVKTDLITNRYLKHYERSKK
jgi:putative hemolysin